MSGIIMKPIIILCLLSFAQLANAEPANFHVAIEGRWNGTSTLGEKVSYNFTKDGKITWFVDEPGFKQQAPKGLAAKYKISVAKPHWKLDIHEFEHPMFKGVTFFAIIEILDENSFRMMGAPDRNGDVTKRPQAFDNETITFTRSNK
jgi:hypothetical protein